MEVVIGGCKFHSLFWVTYHKVIKNGRFYIFYDTLTKKKRLSLDIFRNNRYLCTCNSITPFIRLLPMA